jgi:hypothetical protein
MRRIACLTYPFSPRLFYPRPTHLPEGEEAKCCGETEQLHGYCLTDLDK